ncbi:hypothetical protein ABI59_10530 [Acidobacteria bacterium Mor1]|nr:hypothetical protein ABI59_10530 [Acidobacteria bacterium Mor1]
MLAAMADDASRPYRVESDGEGYAVVDDEGTTILTLRDARSAGHYAELLSRAFDRGYRRGRREARS